MPNIDLSILNQRQTPAFYADTLANRPAAGFVGRIFVSTNTFAFYRDNGTSWDLIGGPGTGTITGSGTNGTIPLWSGASTIGDSILTQVGSTIELKATGVNNAELSLDTTTGNFSRILFQNNNATKAIAYYREDLLQLTYGTYVTGGSVEIETDNNVTAAVFDSSQNTLLYGSLGVGTLTPGAAVDVHSAINVIQQLNQTVVTNNSLLAFQNSGTGLWRIGNFYNGGANDFGVFDVIGGIEPFRIKKTTGQVLIGTNTVGSGKLVVASATSDNGIQIVGASAPSLRIDNAESGPTKRAGFGISTSTNNFIQGSADRDFCMFNGSTTPSPILFGIYNTTNVQEAARISAARNFLIGTTTDPGYKLYVSGTGYFTGTLSSAGLIRLENSASGSIVIGSRSNQIDFQLYNTGNIFRIYDGTRDAFCVNTAGNVGINTTTQSQKLEIIGNQLIRNTLSNASFYFAEEIDNSSTFYQYNNGTIKNIISSNAVSYITGGNLLIGTTTDSGYKLQVNGASQATRFTSSETQVTVSATPTVVFNSGGGSGIWLVTVVVTGNPGQVGFAIVGQRFGGTLFLLSTGVGSQIVLTVSGNTLLASQTAGGSILTSVSNMLINQGG